MEESEEEEDSENELEEGEDHARSEIVKVKRQNTMPSLDLTSNKGFDVLD